MPSSSELNAALADLQTKLDALGDGVTSEDLQDIEEDLSDLLTSNNIYSEDLTIDSEALLEFAENLKDRVAIINGDVSIHITSDLDHDRLQAVVSKMKTVVGDLNIRASSGSVKGLNFDNITGISDNLRVAQAGVISFANLKNVDTLTLGLNYQNDVTEINLGALTTLMRFESANISNSFGLTNTAANQIVFADMTKLNLGALSYYTPASLTIEGDRDFDLDISSLKTVDSDGDDLNYTLSINGAASVSSDLLKNGTITLENVDTVNLSAFIGTVTINEGVREVSLGALTENLDLDASSTSPNNDLEMITLTGKGKTTSRATTYPTVDLSYATSLSDVTVGGALSSINFEGASDLTTAKLDADIDTITFRTNGDLQNLEVSGEVKSLTIDDCDDLETANLDFTTKDAEAGSDLVISGNNNLTSFSADMVNNLKTLTIQNNSDLQTISFDALDADATGTAVANISIGGVNNANDFEATSITRNKTGGSFVSSSGINDLKDFLEDAAKKDGAQVKVYFDSADKYTDNSGDSATTQNNLNITDTNDVAALTVANITSTTTGSTVREIKTWVIPVNTNNFGADLEIGSTGFEFDYDGTKTTWGGDTSGVTNVATLVEKINADTTYDPANIDLTVARDSYKIKNVRIDYTDGKTGATTQTNNDGIITFAFGKDSDDKTVYLQTGNIAATSNEDAIANAISTAINNHANYVSTAAGSIITIQRAVATTTNADLSSLAGSIPDVDIVIDAAQASTTVQFSSTPSNTAALASNTFKIEETHWETTGLRFSVKNKSTSIALKTSALTISNGNTANALDTAPTLLVAGTNMPSTPDSSVKALVASFSDISDPSTSGDNTNRLSWL
ncbi:MAG: hypothetical protein ACON4A_04890 [Flavobacteriaceae bacterium]